MAVKVKVKQTGRIRKPKLDQGPLTKIGNEMVAAQKKRWSEARNAQGNTAKKLSVKYAIIKQKFLHAQAKRDNKMTGVMADNFSLRKAINNEIRAENTTRLARAHANGAVKYEDMIGFSGPEQLGVFNSFQREYGKYVKSAWIQIG